MDREGKDPLALIDDVESTLGMKCYPVTWPLGMGDRFRGLFHRLENKVYLYRKGEEAPEVHEVQDGTDEKIRGLVGDEIFNQLQDELGLLEGVIGEFSAEEFLRGEVSPMTFGSAKHNWGVDLFLDLFAQHAPPPTKRAVVGGGVVDPYDKALTGFVFKIQANMDRKHRDRVAFIRLCSGRFERGMKVKHVRLEREVRLAYANQFLAAERETVDEAYAGDIVGITDTGLFRIGDCVTTGKDVMFEKIPRFSPEIFGRLSIKDPLKRKQLQKGISQLAEEGTVQLLYEPHLGKQDPIIGAVGELQFEVLLFRLNDEYGLDVKLERLPFGVARWPVTKDGVSPKDGIRGGAKVVVDEDERPVVLVEREWDLNWIRKENADLEFLFAAPTT
jgi:peptide chain release factor 3